MRKGRAPDEGYYRILIDKSQEEIVAKLEELKALIEKGDLKPWEFSGMKAIWFGRHLYQPLLYLDSNIVEISPVPLNKGERQFVEDLKAFHDGNGDFFESKELYLLRNLSKGRGVGFFEAGNFHPDFILWLLVGRPAACHLRRPEGHPEPRPDRSEDPVPRDHQGDRAAPRRSDRAPAVLHRLEHAVAHDADALEHGEERDAEAARPVPGGGQGHLRAEHARPRGRVAKESIVRFNRQAGPLRKFPAHRSCGFHPPIEGADPPHLARLSADLPRWITRLIRSGRT